MIVVKNVFEIAEPALAAIGAGYLVHKIFVAVEFVVAKAQAVKTALVSATPTAPVAKA